MLAQNVPFDRFASKSRFLPRPLPGRGIETAIRWLERWPGSSNPGGAGVTIFAWGGAINRVAPRRTAFVHRDAAFLMDCETTWTARTPSAWSAPAWTGCRESTARSPGTAAAGVPELHRPGAAGLARRLLRREPAPADPGQARLRPGPGVPLRPVHPGHVAGAGPPARAPATLIAGSEGGYRADRAGDRQHDQARDPDRLRGVQGVQHVRHGDRVAGDLQVVGRVQRALAVSR